MYYFFLSVYVFNDEYLSSLQASLIARRLCSFLIDGDGKVLYILLDHNETLCAIWKIICREFAQSYFVPQSI